MELKMTQRDKKLLIFLSIFILVVGVGYFGILPLHQAFEEKKILVEQLEQEQAIAEQKVHTLVSMEKSNKEIKQKKNESSEAFYDLMESQDIDKMLTTMVLQAGLEARNLSITMPTEPWTVAYYTMYTGERMDISDYEPVVTDAQLSQEDEILDLEDGQTTMSVEMPETDARCLYVADVTMEIAGNRDRLQDLIDTYSNDTKYPSIQVKGYSWDESGRSDLNILGGVEYVPETILNLNLQIFMCEKE